MARESVYTHENFHFHLHSSLVVEIMNFYQDNLLFAKKWLHVSLQILLLSRKKPENRACDQFPEKTLKSYEVRENGIL